MFVNSDVTTDAVMLASEERCDCCSEGRFLERFFQPRNIYFYFWGSYFCSLHPPGWDFSPAHILSIHPNSQTTREKCLAGDRVGTVHPSWKYEIFQNTESETLNHWIWDNFFNPVVWNVIRFEFFHPFALFSLHFLRSLLHSSPPPCPLSLIF